MGTNNLAAAALLTALVPFALANPNPNPQFGSVADSIRASMTADLPSFISEFNNADNFPTLSGFSEATNAVSSTVSVTTDQGGSPYLGAVSSLFSGGIIYPEDSEFGSATGAAGSSASELIGGLSSSLDSALTSVTSSVGGVVGSTTSRASSLRTTTSDGAITATSTAVIASATGGSAPGMMDSGIGLGGVVGAAVLAVAAWL